MSSGRPPLTSSARALQSSAPALQSSAPALQSSDFQPLHSRKSLILPCLTKSPVVSQVVYRYYYPVCLSGTHLLVILQSVHSLAYQQTSSQLSPQLLLTFQHITLTNGRNISSTQDNIPPPLKSEQYSPQLHFYILTNDSNIPSIQDNIQLSSYST